MGEGEPAVAEAPAAAGKRPGAVSELWFTLRPLLAIAAFVALSLHFNEAVIRYRMGEYNRAMRAISRSYASSHSLNMLARFELIRARSRDADDEGEAALELRLRSLGSGELTDSSMASRGWEERSIALLIRGVEFLLGKDTPKLELPEGTRKELEVGYFYERSRKYDKAVEIYANALEAKAGGDGLKSTLLLHKAFCEALLGDYPTALRDFRRAAEANPRSEDAYVAEKLSAVLQELSAQVAEAKRNRAATPLDAARQMFRLANYQEAIRGLVAFLDGGSGAPAERQEAQYLLGRSQEELGLEDEALEQYRDLVDRAPGSPFARKANRRVYILGKFYTQDKQVEQSALKKVEQLGDFSFIDKLKALDPARRAAADSARVAVQAAAKAAEAAVGGTQALGAGSALERLEHVEAAPVAEPKPAASREAGERPAATVHAAAPRPSSRPHGPDARLLADPLRREAIYGVIENNQGDLQFIYQKWLRRGDPFEGSLTVRVVVAPDGGVKDARLVTEKSTIANEAFCADVLQNVKKWKFRADPGADADIPVTFPVQFVNKQ